MQLSIKMGYIAGRGTIPFELECLPQSSRDRLATARLITKAMETHETVGFVYLHPRQRLWIQRGGQDADLLI